MSPFLSILIIVACVLLVLIVLIQNPKGGGISSNLISSNQIFGARQQVELIEQITWGFAIAIVLLCLAAAYFAGGTSSSAPAAGKSVITNMDATPGQAPPQTPNFTVPADTTK